MMYPLQPIEPLTYLRQQQRGAFLASAQPCRILGPSEQKPFWYSSLSIYVALLTIISR